MTVFTLADGYSVRMNSIDYSVLFDGDDFQASSKVFRVFFYDADATVDFRGSGFKYDADGVPTRGTVNSYAITISGERAMVLSDFKISATEFVDAASSFSLKDDQRLVAHIFAGNDSIKGANLADTLIGYAGNDRLYGYSGNDRLDGGRGTDILAGGKGADTFVFRTGYGKDTITDFVESGSGHDKINLSALSAVTDYSDLKFHHLEDHGHDVWIHAGKDVLVIRNIEINNLSASDFIF